MIKKIVFIFALVLMPLICNGQVFLSVQDVLGMRKSVIRNDNQAAQILKARGYTKQFKSEDSNYFYKNCKLTVIDGSIYDPRKMEASPKSAQASFVEVYQDEYKCTQYFHIEVTVYGKANAQKWLAQLKGLGYRINTSMSYSGFGQNNWYYEKRGYPILTLKNEGSTYTLGIAIEM